MSLEAISPLEDSIEEPDNFFEQQDAANRITAFAGESGDVALEAGAPQQQMPMLVAVRVRPLWAKESDAGDYNTVRVLESKVVVVLDPWYDKELNPNRAKEAAERRKASGEAAPTALGSRPDAGKELHEWVLAEEAKEKAAFEAMATPAAALLPALSAAAHASSSTLA